MLKHVKTLEWRRWRYLNLVPEASHLEDVCLSMTLKVWSLAHLISLISSLSLSPPVLEESRSYCSSAEVWWFSSWYADWCMFSAGPLHCKINQALTHMTCNRVLEGVVTPGEEAEPFWIAFLHYLQSYGSLMTKSRLETAFDFKVWLWF